MRLKIEIYKDAGNLWRWRAIRGGHIVADSGEGYTRRSHVIRALRSLAAAVKKLQ